MKKEFNRFNLYFLIQLSDENYAKINYFEKCKSDCLLYDILILDNIAHMNTFTFFKAFSYYIYVVNVNRHK